MDIELVLVPEAQKAELACIVDEYLKEHGGFQETRTGPETVADYIYFPEYWREPGRYPYTINDGSQVVGFVLVRTVFEEPECCYQLSDFYILPALRRQGLGKIAVSLLWGMYPGRWELQLLARNVVAKDFWSRCVSEICAGPAKITQVKEADGMRVQFNFLVPGT